VMAAARGTSLQAGLLVALLCAAAPAGASPEARSEARARMMNIDQHLEAWDVAAARAELDALSALAPEGTEPIHYYAGRVLLEEGRYAEAVTALEKAGVADKPGSWLRIAQDTLAVTKDHVRSESEHFIVSHPPGKDAVLVPWALEALERARAALEQDLGYAPPGKVRIEFVNTARELSKVSTLSWESIKTTGTIAICKFNKLMVTSPKATLNGYDWLDTVSHEYVHLVVSKASHNTVPIWLHEGLAKYLESRWRGAPGLAMTPPTLGLLGRRVKQDKLIPFEKMHPSIALLPSAEDAATAFAEVYFAIDLIFRENGQKGLRTLLEGMKAGMGDKKAVEQATGKAFPAFEKAWLAHVRKQPFPKELIPLEDKVVLKEAAGQKAVKDKHGPEVNFGDFANMEEPEARRNAHLGELLQERGRARAAAEAWGRAHKLVGAKYERLSNRYARALAATGHEDEAERVLNASLRTHPGVAATLVQLGRIRLKRHDWGGAREAYLEALAQDPFDPEIHFALARSARELDDDRLSRRAFDAAVLLTGMEPAKVDAFLKQPIP